MEVKKKIKVYGGGHILYNKDGCQQNPPLLERLAKEMEEFDFWFPWDNRMPAHMDDLQMNDIVRRDFRYIDKCDMLIFSLLAKRLKCEEYGIPVGSFAELTYGYLINKKTIVITDITYILKSKWIKYLTDLLIELPDVWYYPTEIQSNIEEVCNIIRKSVGRIP